MTISEILIKELVSSTLEESRLEKLIYNNLENKYNKKNNLRLIKKL